MELRLGVGEIDSGDIACGEITDHICPYYATSEALEEVRVVDFGRFWPILAPFQKSV